MCLVRSRTKRNTQEVADAIVYNPEEGTAVWKETGEDCCKVQRSDDRYDRVVIQHRDNTYVAARVFYFIMTREQPKQVDHADTNSTNNKWSNLRAATGHQNQRNRGKNSNNKSGYKGVSFMPEKNKWRATCCGKHLGLFSSPEAAHEAYVEYATANHGRFARH